MDAASTREQLAALVRDEVRCLSELADLLAVEHEVLKRNDIAQLESASDARQFAMGRLLRLQDERRALLAMLGLPPGNESIERLLQLCDADLALRTRWSQCAQLAERCRDLNHRNGALVAARMNRVAGLLRIVTGQDPRSAVYGRDGVLESESDSRFLAARA